MLITVLKGFPQAIWNMVAPTYDKLKSKAIKNANEKTNYKLMSLLNQHTYTANGPAKDTMSCICDRRRP